MLKEVWLCKREKNILFFPQQKSYQFISNSFITRLHSSRMRAARLLTVSHSIVTWRRGGGVCLTREVGLYGWGVSIEGVCMEGSVWRGSAFQQCDVKADPLRRQTPCEQTNTRENITFPILHMQAVITTCLSVI